MGENPVMQTRMALGLGRRDFALAAGVDYQTLFRTEAGYLKRLPSGIAGFLADKGRCADPGGDYLRWREALGEQTRRRVPAGTSEEN
jgi:hypothetical protein